MSKANGGEAEGHSSIIPHTESEDGFPPPAPLATYIKLVYNVLMREHPESSDPELNTLVKFARKILDAHYALPSRTYHDGGNASLRTKVPPELLQSLPSFNATASFDSEDDHAPDSYWTVLVNIGMALCRQINNNPELQKKYGQYFEHGVFLGLFAIDSAGKLDEILKDLSPAAQQLPSDISTDVHRKVDDLF